MSNRPKWLCVNCKQKNVLSLTIQAVPEQPLVTCESQGCGYNKTLNEYIKDKRPERNQDNT